MQNQFDLTGKVALVTGANTGIGQGIAVALASAGAKLCLVSRSSSSGTKSIIEATGGQAQVILRDLADGSDLNGLVNGVVASFGRIDILVNNAGIIARNDAITFTEEQWDSVLDVNLRSVFFLSQAVAKHFISKGQPGKIINIASMLSFQGGIRVPSYTASKSALAGLTKALANEWAENNINVNAIAPGYFITNNTAALRDDEARSKDILGRIPAKRWGEPKDLGGAAVFLASTASDYVHGITLPVDGGWLAR